MKQEFNVTCPFCAVGCRFKILKGMDEVVFSSKTLDVLDYDYDHPVNEGALCPKGHFSYELLSHPMRLGRAYYKSNGKLNPEIPEITFRNIAKKMTTKGSKPSLGILINPMISLHDIRALLDFANNNGIHAVDFITPTDRHFFRALIDTPFDYKRCDDVRKIKNLTYILNIGDVFTKQPILSRHLLSAKYAFRKNALFTINSIPSRTSWFANIHIENPPHAEPYVLFYLFNKIYHNKKQEIENKDLKDFHQLISDSIGVSLKKYITQEQASCLDQIADALLSTTNSAIFLSTHHYNAAAGYILGLTCSAISILTDSFFIPLYTDSNFNAIEQFSKEIYKNLAIGQKPVLKLLQDNKLQYVIAAGWNPQNHIPGKINFSPGLNWLIFSLVQGEYPENTLALLPQAHLYEQMDLRTNFIMWQSIGSPEVKSPIGSARPISHFIYQFHQKITENKISFESNNIKKIEKSWKENLKQELSYYFLKLNELSASKGLWLIPNEHVAHYKDGDLTSHSSWAQKTCVDDTLTIPVKIAKNENLKPNQHFNVQYRTTQLLFKTNFSKDLSEDKVIAFSHYLPVRKNIYSEFADHNKEYYFWCPKINFNK